MIPSRAASLDLLLTPFPRERRWLLPALQSVQREHGYLSADALAAVSAHVRVPASEVYGVATGYPEFRLHPHGTHHVRVCTGVTCALLGGRDVLARLEARFGSPRGGGESSTDNRPPERPIVDRTEPADVTVEAADCFFQCSMGPLVEVDGAYVGRCSTAEADRIEERLSATQPHSVIARPVRSRPSLKGTDSASAALDRLVADARRRSDARPALRILVAGGTCGRSVGSTALLAAIRRETERRGIAADVVDGACSGMCYAAPLAEVQHPAWPRFVLENLAPHMAGALVEALASSETSFVAHDLRGVAWANATWRGLGPARDEPFWRAQERVLLRRVGSIDPEDLDDALLSGAYRSLARAVDGAPGDVIQEVKAAGLQGRGGAFFPTAVKWEACRSAAGEPKYLVMNGEEGEPGIFKDRHLMEGDPHQVLEGALTAAFAAGATRVILYIHGEADLSAARLERAVAEAEGAGIIGERVLGRDVACHVEILRGAGGFVLGEETALLESIEGRRAQPRTRPPFPVESGLWGKPTVINNVETLSSLPVILEGGAERFVALGTPKASGTKVFGLSGPIRCPAVVETRNGVTLRTLVETIGGGLADGGRVAGALVGGPSGTIVPASLFDVPMEPRGEVSTGTGGVVAVPENASILDIVKTLLAFNARESCGKCTPCREGAPRLLAMIDDLVAADGDAVRARVRDLAETMQYASLCGLGQAAPLALLRALETFPSAFRRA